MEDTARPRRPARSVEAARTSNACDPCRSKKVKCSGQQPCSYCAQRSLECVFSRPEKRKLAYSSQLRELQDKVARFEQQTRTTPAQNNIEDQPGPPASHTTPVPPCISIGSEPGTPRSIYVGPGYVASAAVPSPATSGRVAPASALSSTETFGSEVRMLLVSGPSRVTVISPSGSAAAIEGWPSEVEANELLELVASHVGVSQQLFDVRILADNMSLLYTDTSSQVNVAELLIVQMCLVFAIGRLLQAKPEENGDLPGTRFFNEAMRRMPTCLSLRQYHLLGIEVPGLTALYLQITDRKADAYLYSNMALHLAISHGLHNTSDTSYRSENIRSNRLWWSIYMQDRRLCAAGGYPMSIEDHAISTRAPFDAAGYASATALAVNTQTARITGRITSTIYSRKDMQEHEFTNEVQNILHALHDIETTMPAEYTMRFEPSRLTIAGKDFAEAPLISARTSAGLYISVFSAVIHAVRPILLHMARRNRHPEGAQAVSEMNPSLVRLAEICVETSSKMLAVLKQLRTREILAKHAFLDLDTTFSVGFIFVLVEAIDPGKNLGLDGINGCRSILRNLADLGNRAAANRLTELEQMCANLTPIEPALDPTLQTMSATPTAIGILTKPFSFTSIRQRSGSRHPGSPNAHGQSTADPSFAQHGTSDAADFCGADLASLPLDDIDSLYWTYHPPGLAFTGVEQADWESLEHELFQGI
ncbi:hypothetical protein EKO04_005317 [Ascochyta lentis]|uniref:Zn(2)-C6 fungal-type domain-containing protein n=1 Tax=Ascochyta lentis TaxID=205686 RepID=A0A8H7MDT3_9PLEO|nr:hypothetical protein EKO04_005317 [Ascochyta lentis]